MSWGHNLSPRYNKFVAGMVSYRDLAKPVSRIGVSGALLIATPAFFWYLGEATTKEVCALTVQRVSCPCFDD